MPQRTKALACAQFDTTGFERDPGAFADVEQQTQAYFRGERMKFSIAVDLSELPAFTASVLEASRRIPYGATATYGELAQRLGKPGAARAVGQAMGRNPVPIVVPCHRVVGCSGLGGFSADEGVDLKRRLLALEGALP